MAWLVMVPVATVARTLPKIHITSILHPAAVAVDGGVFDDIESDEGYHGGAR